MVWPIVIAAPIWLAADVPLSRNILWMAAQITGYTLVGQTIAFRGLPPSGSDGRRHKPIVCPTETDARAPGVPDGRRPMKGKRILRNHQ